MVCPGHEQRALSLDGDRQGTRSCRRGHLPTKWGQKGACSGKTGSQGLQAEQGCRTTVGSHAPGPEEGSESTSPYTREPGNGGGGRRR